MIFPAVSSLRRLVPALFLAAALLPALSAQTVPTVTAPLPARSLLVGGAAATVDLRNHFGLPGVTGQVVQIDTVLGRFNFELFDDTPLSKANFLAYVAAERYSGTLIHRSVANFVIQGGGYLARTSFDHIPTFAAVRNEYRRSNLRGTVAMAKVGGNPDSATSEWFVNLADNSANLDNQNGGFTVFARVLGAGMNVVDAIAALPRYNINGTAFSELPLRDVTANQTSVEVRNMIIVNSVTAIPVYPPATRSVITFLAQSSNPAVATVILNGSTLTVSPLGLGSATITVRATDTNNAIADATFAVEVTAGLAIVTPPQSRHVAPGAAATFSVLAQSPAALTYQWRKDGVAIPGATGASYTVPAAAAGDMGFYAVAITSGGATTVTDAAALTVSVPGTSRLVNVSTRGSVRAGEPLTPGFVMRGTGTKNLVVRAVGPTLGAFGVAGALADPKMDVIPLGQSNVILANDDWGTAPAADVVALEARSASVGAFALTRGSKDAAALAALPVNGSGGYTVSITPAGGATAGTALAEIYDADGLAAPVRLINVSTLGAVTADGLTPGFVIGGSAPKLLLIRAVGPALSGAPFNVAGALADPQLSVFPLGKDFAVATNNDWGDGGQAATLQAAFASAGAFALPAGSKDAAVLVRLPPGAYTAVASGVGGTVGRALVEVYDLDP